MRPLKRLLLLGLGASLAFAQLTTDQKVADFNALASLYAKRYGPYEWKRDAIKFDLMNITPWLSRVQNSKDDLEFFDIMSEYVASLNDAHDTYQLPANFAAQLNFTVDIFDGKLLVESINRTRLPASEFGFNVGYELVSIDGQDAQKLLDTLLRYQIAANPRSTRRLAAELLTIRLQALMPHATDVPEISTVVFRRADGKLDSYRIPWTKTGLPLVSVGKMITPKAVASRPIPRRNRRGDPATSGGTAFHSDVLERLQNCMLPDRGVVGFGSVFPVFVGGLPSNFALRLGRTTADPFFSGTFDAGGYKIGFIRIPSYSPSSTTTALTAFQKEIAYFQANTDGLVIDDMRNPGGSGSYVNSILSLVMPTTWRAIPFRVRATSEWVYSISSEITQAQSLGAPQEIIDLLLAIQNAIMSANRQMRGLTDPIPLDDVVIDRDPAMDSKGNIIAYTKPMIVLVDEMSASAAEIFAATIQDSGRAPLLGWRTMGAGGSVEPWEAGGYSQGITTVTESLMIRKNDIVTPEYPTAPYVENIGVRPEIQVDYMTRDNLMQSGKPFVDSFVSAIVAQIKKGN